MHCGRPERVLPRKKLLRGLVSAVAISPLSLTVDNTANDGLYFESLLRYAASSLHDDRMIVDAVP
jgi:hypothetical protein